MGAARIRPPERERPGRSACRALARAAADRGRPARGRDGGRRVPAAASAGRMGAGSGRATARPAGLRRGGDRGAGRLARLLRRAVPAGAGVAGSAAALPAGAPGHAGVLPGQPRHAGWLGDRFRAEHRRVGNRGHRPGHDRRRDRRDQPGVLDRPDRPVRDRPRRHRRTSSARGLPGGGRPGPGPGGRRAGRHLPDGSPPRDRRAGGRARATWRGTCARTSTRRRSAGPAAGWRR